VLIVLVAATCCFVWFGRCQCSTRLSTTPAFVPPRSALPDDLSARSHHTVRLREHGRWPWRGDKTPCCCRPSKHSVLIHHFDGVFAGATLPTPIPCSPSLSRARGCRDHRRARSPTRTGEGGSTMLLPTRSATSPLTARRSLHESGRAVTLRTGRRRPGRTAELIRSPTRRARTFARLPIATAHFRSPVARALAFLHQRGMIATRVASREISRAARTADEAAICARRDRAPTTRIAKRRGPRALTASAVLAFKDAAALCPPCAHARAGPTSIPELSGLFA